MWLKWFKRLIPDRHMPMHVLSGPFRGARILLRPRISMRKILGVYEHELNAWLAAALPRVERVLDVGANDGYFSIGCAAALRRLHGHGEVVAFEPEEDTCRLLEESARPYQGDRLRIRVIPSFVGSGSREGVTALDRVSWQLGDPGSRQGVLIKIDVEGAEEDVLDGAASFIRPGNLFLIEAHCEEFLTTIPARFAARGLRLRRIDQQPLRLLGRELRSENNWWLVSELA